MGILGPTQPYLAKQVFPGMNLWHSQFTMEAMVQVGVPNHQISFIWTGRALGDCMAAVITSVIFRFCGGLTYMEQLLMQVISGASFANPGRSWPSSPSASSSQEVLDSLFLSSPASPSSCRLSWAPASSSAATTRRTTPSLSTCLGRTSSFPLSKIPLALACLIQVSSLHPKSSRLHVCWFRLK